MSAFAGLRNIILIGTLFGFHGLLNRSLLIDGVNEMYIVTLRVSIVTIIISLYCLKEFLSNITLDFFLKGSLSGILAIFYTRLGFYLCIKIHIFRFTKHIYFNYSIIYSMLDFSFLQR